MAGWVVRDHAAGDRARTAGGGLEGLADLQAGLQVPLALSDGRLELRRGRLGDALGQGLGLLAHAGIAIVAASGASGGGEQRGDEGGTEATQGTQARATAPAFFEGVAVGFFPGAAVLPLIA